MQYFTPQTNIMFSKTLYLASRGVTATVDFSETLMTEGTRPNLMARQSLHYLEYAFWAAAAIAYNAGLLTRETLDYHLNNWYEANRSDIEALQANAEYRTAPVARAFISHIASGSTGRRIVGGLKKSARLALGLLRNIQEGMFPRIR
jgi:hypothetical protein